MKSIAQNGSIDNLEARFSPDVNGNGAGEKQPSNTKRKRGDGDTISARIARDLAKWGYDLWLNDLDDDVYNGDARLDDPARATLRMTARDAGYAENRLLSALEDATLAIAAKNRRHPLREYLNGLRWDGNDHMAHLATFFPDRHDPIVYADGTRRSVFHAFLERWLIGSVAKIHGDSNATRSNFMLVLAGLQDAGKSHLAQWLCPIPGYSVEKHISPDNKDDSLERANTWIWEVGELGATTRRADVEALKAFLTATTVTERKPYGHTNTTKPAIASYIGTVNGDGAGFLVDTTGNRRFAVVELEAINWAYDGAVNVAQLWAQAMHLWRNDPKGYRFTPEEKAMQQANADNSMEPDVIMDMIVRLCDVDSKQGDWRMTSSELLHVLRTYGDMTRSNDRQAGKDIARSLKRLGITGKRSNGATVYHGVQPKPHIVKG